MYPEEFLANARAVASLAHECWENITIERVLRVIDKILKSKSLLFIYFLVFSSFIVIML